MRLYLFAGASQALFAQALVHDVNMVHGLLETMGGSIRNVVAASVVAGGEGGFAAAVLAPNEAMLSMSWIATPKLAHYSERISLIFDDRIFELQFPSPYLNHQPTSLVERRSSGFHQQTIRHRLSYEEPFVEELRGWHRAITRGSSAENTVEQALIDMNLIALLGRRARADQ